MNRRWLEVQSARMVVSHRGVPLLIESRETDDITVFEQHANLIGKEILIILFLTFVLPLVISAYASQVHASNLQKLDLGLQGRLRRS